jgi:hypothetical protein
MYNTEREGERERSRLGREAEEAEGAESNSIIYIYRVVTLLGGG